MELRLDNRSGYDTEDLRRFVRRGLRACGVRRTVLVTIMASPIRSRGCADIGGHRIVLPVAAPSRTTERERIRRLARVLEHECEHLKGRQHREMTSKTLYSSGETPAWARGLRLRKVGRAPDQMKAMLGGFRDTPSRKDRDEEMKSRRHPHGWELWTRGDRHEAPHFIRTFSDKELARRHMRALKRSHPGVDYMLKRRRVAAKHHTYEARRPARRAAAHRDPSARKKAHHHRTKGAPSFAMQAKISRKIRLLIREGYSSKQAAAIAYHYYGVSRPRARSHR